MPSYVWLDICVKPEHDLQSAQFVQQELKQVPLQLVKPEAHPQALAFWLEPAGLMAFIAKVAEPAGAAQADVV